MNSFFVRGILKYIRATCSHPGRGLLLDLAYALCFRGSARCNFVSDVNGFRMLVSSSDRGIGRELRRHHIHEPIATALFPAMLAGGTNVLDIGANIGYYTLLAARCVTNEGRVVAVEPHPDNYDLLTRNVRINGFNNVITIKAAVSDLVGTSQLFVSSRSNWHSLNPKHEYRPICSIPVDTLTVDELAENLGIRFGLIRMDVEGWELNILRAAKKTLTAARPRIVMEVHPPLLGADKTLELLGYLDDLRYSVVFLVRRPDDDPAWRPKRPWVLTASLRELRTMYANLIVGPYCFSLFLEPSE